MTAFTVDFKYVPIWVQVWGLPFDLINEEVGKDINGGIGRVLEVDCKAIAITKLASYKLELNYHWISQSEGELQYLAQRV